jgi:hypothetical protein
MAEATKKAPKSNAPAKASKPASGAKPVRPNVGKATPAAPEGERCSVDKCKQPIRAKGLCRKHYLAWRRGESGKKQRYNTCSKEGCRKPAVLAGRCEEHKKSGEKKAA